MIESPIHREQVIEDMAEILKCALMIALDCTATINEGYVSPTRGGRAKYIKELYVADNETKDILMTFVKTDYSAQLNFKLNEKESVIMSASEEIEGVRCLKSWPESFENIPDFVGDGLCLKMCAKLLGDSIGRDLPKNED